MRELNVGFWFRRAGLLLSQMILIAAFGCGPAPTPIIIELPTHTQSASQVTQPAGTATAFPALEIFTPTAFVPRAVIKIFSIAPLSGGEALFGQNIMQGAELAVRQLSDPLKAFSYEVQLASYDDQNLAETALENARTLAADPDVLCGVGHFDSAITLAASDIYHQAGLGFVAPSTTSPLLTDRSFLETNRLVGREDGQGLAAAQFASARGYRTVFIVGTQGETSLLNAEYFRTASGSLGVQWLGSSLKSITNENMDKVVRQVMGANPDLLYISSTADQALPFLMELRAAGYPGAILGTESLNDPALMSSGGASLLQGGGLFLTISTPSAGYYPDAIQFIQDYRATYGQEPLAYAARAYDAAGMCLKAVEKATEAKGGTPPTRLEVARALRRLNNYKGITGTYDFNREGDPDPVSYYIMQVSTTDRLSWDQNPIMAAYEITPP